MDRVYKRADSLCLTDVIFKDGKWRPILKLEMMRESPSHQKDYRYVKVDTSYGQYQFFSGAAIQIETRATK